MDKEKAALLIELLTSAQRTPANYGEMEVYFKETKELASRCSETFKDDLAEENAEA